MNKIIQFFLLSLQKSLSRENIVEVNDVTSTRWFKPNYIYRSIYNESLR